MILPFASRSQVVQWVEADAAWFWAARTALVRLVELLRVSDRAERWVRGSLRAAERRPAPLLRPVAWLIAMAARSRTFIFDSYANRVGKGTHAALDRCTEYARQHRYVLQGDVRLFFPSIDHEILLTRLGRRIWDPRVMELATRIVAHSNAQPAADFYFPGDDLFTPIYRRPYSFVAEIPDPSNSSFQSSIKTKRAPCATTWSVAADGLAAGASPGRQAR